MLASCLTDRGDIRDSITVAITKLDDPATELTTQHLRTYKRGI